MPHLTALPATTTPSATRPQAVLCPLPPRKGQQAPAPLRKTDEFSQGCLAARTASTIGETTLKLLKDVNHGPKITSSPVAWVTVAGFADGMAIQAEDPKVQTACMLAGHYGGYRFGLAAPLAGTTASLIAVTGVTAAAILPQLTAQTLSDPLNQTPADPANREAAHRAAVIGGSVGAGLALTTVVTHPNLMRPAAAVSLVALGAASGYLDGKAAVTSQRKEQAVATGLGHVAGFAMTAAVPGMSAASQTAMTRAGLAGVALVPFVVASLDAQHQANKKHP